MKARLLRDAKAQKGDPPAEDPLTLLAEADGLAAAWGRLVRLFRAQLYRERRRRRR